MSTSIADCVLIGSFASTFSVPVLTAPAALAARRVLARRAAPPLARTKLEAVLVLASAAAGALSAVAWSTAIATALHLNGDMSLLLGFIAPAPLAAIPWFAGEMLSGASLRQLRSLAISIATCSAVAWIGHAQLDYVREVSFQRVAALLAIELAAALTAAATYLASRGPARPELPPEALALEDAL